MSRAPGPEGDGGFLSQLLMFVLISALCGVLVAGLVLPVAGAAGLATRAGSDTFEELPEDLATPPLAQRSTIVDAEGNLLAQFYYENRISVPLSAMSETVRQAIVAIEDSRFYEHNGIDVRGTARAFVNNQTGDSVQGGSTLTQQYVKNVLQETALARGDEEAARAAVEQSYGRKLQELRYALALEERLTKDEILERYLNIAYFGAGAHGVEAAARRYFSRSAADLDLGMAATLAGLVQNPTRYDPTGNPEGAVGRRNVVLDRMAELGVIPPATAEEVKASQLVLDVTPTPNGCSASSAAYFCDFVVQSLREDEALAPTPEERQQLLFRGGLTIRTTLDPRIQDEAQDAVDSNIPRDDPSQIGTAISMVRPGDGAIVAMAQNRTWGEGDGSGRTQINYNVENRYRGSTYGFQAGSTFKPFTAAAAIQQGFPITRGLRSPQRATFDDFETCDGRELPPYETSNSTRSGTFDMRQAMAYSVNTYFVGLSERIGVCAPVQVATDLGLTRAQDSEPLNQYASFTLGTEGVAPLRMAEAYAAFAARGRHCRANGVTEVLDRDGTPLPLTRQPCEQVLDPAVADAVNELLVGVIDGDVPNPTGRNADIGRPAAGKTGTTSENYDVWFVGHTPDMATAVWVGDPGRPDEDGEIVRQRMRNVTINGERVQAAGGGSLAGPIWREAMEAALEGVPPTDFPEPDPAAVTGFRVTVPDVRGMPRDRALEALRDAGLDGSVSNRRVDSGAVDEGRVARTEPRAGSKVFSGDEVVLRISTGDAPSSASDDAGSSSDSSSDSGSDSDDD